MSEASFGLINSKFEPGHIESISSKVAIVSSLDGYLTDNNLRKEKALTLKELDGLIAAAEEFIQVLDINSYGVSTVANGTFHLETSGLKLLFWLQILPS